MSELRQPQAARLIAGFLFRDFEVQRSVLEALRERFGPLDLLTEPLPFTYTRYYDREMGPDLFRQVGSFLTPVNPVELPDIKLFTNRLETQYAVDGRRRINIDPGLLSEERVILATGKNFTHRIYLRDGIYADLTLLYQSGAYQVLPWTYPDYREAGLLHLFAALRQKLVYERSGKLPRKATAHGDSP
jgi:hypothetical protein